MHPRSVLDTNAYSKVIMSLQLAQAKGSYIKYQKGLTLTVLAEAGPNLPWPS